MIHEPDAVATIHFRQHVPGYVDVDPWRGEFHCVDDILARFDHWRDNTTFHRFSQSRAGSSLWFLMAELRSGAEYWVLGFSDTDLALPEMETHPCLVPTENYRT